MKRLVPILLSCSLPVLLGADLRTLAGKHVDGDLSAITDKEIVMIKDGKRTAVPFAEILQIDLQKAGEAPPGKGPVTDVGLSDGSVLHCKKVSFKGKLVQLILAGSRLVNRDSSPVDFLHLERAQDAPVRQEWEEKVLSKRGNQDQVVIRRDNTLNALGGTLGEGTATGQIEFTLEVGGERRTRSLDLERVQGLVFQRTPPAEAVNPLCKVFDLRQNLLTAARLELTPDKLRVFTVSGATIDVPRTALLRLDFTNDKIVYLSDMKPASMIYKSLTGRNDPPRMDTNLDGKGPLQVKGEVFSKGLAVHANTELIYNLDGKYKKLEAVLGMDDVVGGDGQPRVRIEGDGKELFGQVVSRKDERRHLDLDVRGVRQLRVTVTSAHRPFAFEAHVDLANAKLSK